MEHYYILNKKRYKNEVNNANELFCHGIYYIMRSEGGPMLYNPTEKLLFHNSEGVKKRMWLQISHFAHFNTCLI